MGVEADNQYIGRGSHHNMQPDCDTKYDLKLRPTMLMYTFLYDAMFPQFF